MTIDLKRNDVLQLIEVGTICKDGVTITLRDSRQAAPAARMTPAAAMVEMPIKPRVRNWEPARELEFRKGNPLND